METLLSRQVTGSPDGVFLREPFLGEHSDIVELFCEDSKKS